MKNNLLNIVTETLKQDDRFVSEDGILLKNIIREQANKLDEKLISLLLDNDITREKFFIKIKDVIVFDINKFSSFINNKEFLPDSYTSFKNKIGLTTEKGDFIASSNEVALSFPFKDCVLVGWQDKEDAKRDEIFYNEILGQDDIDRLFDKKVFTNFKRIDKDWEHKLEWFNRDENWDIKDNLIIKWNNLLALHSLKSNFAGKVKLIYIDPPYNTWSDSFKYNDKFNHSTWLTFMKNRLEVAKDLLRDDWVIFVQCDTSRNMYWSPEMFYLWILMDEIFWRNNFIWNLHWKKKKQPSFLSRIAWIMESILVYSKNEKNIEKFSIDWISDSNKPIINSSNNFSIIEFDSWIRVKLKSNKIEKWEYLNRSMKIEFLNDIYIENGRTVNNFKAKAQFRTWQENISKFIKDDLIFITSNFWLRRDLTKDEKWKDKAITDLLLEWGQNQDADEEIKQLFNLKTNNIFSNPKPELLLFNLIKSITEEDDLVLDYHLWSGTTCAVAHKMWRQYIWIEQMDYIETISVERMKKVIEWEDWWISKAVNWQGGWEFIYMEIMQENERFINEIKIAKNIKDLQSIYNQIKDSEFINYKVDTWSLNFDNLEEKDFEDFKLFLIEILDKNLLYKNYSEINDKNSGVSEEDKKINESFYGS